MSITTCQDQLPDLTAYALLHLTKQAKASGVYSSLATYFDKPEVKDRLMDSHGGDIPAGLEDLELRDDFLEKERRCSVSSSSRHPQEDACHASSKA
jgi:hypothetical protein